MEIRAFGRVERTCDEEGLVQLSEVTFQVSPETLRRIASFLQDAAADLEVRGGDFGHRHFRSRQEDWSGCDVIVAGESCDESPAEVDAQRREPASG